MSENQFDRLLDECRESSKEKVDEYVSTHRAFDKLDPSEFEGADIPKVLKDLHPVGIDRSATNVYWIEYTDPYAKEDTSEERWNEIKQAFDHEFGKSIEDRSHQFHYFVPEGKEIVLNSFNPKHVIVVTFRRAGQWMLNQMLKEE